MGFRLQHRQKMLLVLIKRHGIIDIIAAVHTLTEILFFLENVNSERSRKSSKKRDADCSNMTKFRI